MIDKRDSNLLKTIAITLVILSHLAGMTGKLDDYARNLLGTGGVCLFLFLSGYGIYLSYAKNGMHRSFWDNKFERILVPYWVVTLLYVALMRRDLPLETITRNLLFIDFSRHIDGTMWYMSFIILLYLLTFLLFSAKTNDLIKILLLVAACFCIRGIALERKIFDQCSWQFVQNSFSFPLGMLLARLSLSGAARKAVAVLRPLTVKILFLLIGLTGYITVAGLLRNSSATFQSQGIFLCIFFFSLTSLVRPLLPEMIVKVLNRTGEASYTVYLVEMKLIIIVTLILPDGNSVSKIGLFAALLVVSTVIFEMLWHFLMHPTQRRKPAPSDS